MNVRLYQKECADAIFKQWETVQSTIAVLPTGCGKTRVASEVILRVQPKRTLFLAHREELIFQAQRQIKAATGLESEIEMGDLKASTSLFNNMPVMISTIQTQIAGKNGGRMTKFRPTDFSYIIVDEVHHAVSPSYIKVLEYYKQNKDIKILGLTATPDRTDELAIGKIMETVAFEYKLVNAIHDGWLVPIQQQIVSISSLDFSNVRTTAGDLNGADLAAVMEDEKNLQGMVGASIEILGSRKAIAFTSSVRHAEMCCSIFNRHRSGMACWICGETERSERRLKLKDFAENKTQVLCNVGIATEGFDCPDVQVVIMGRPTKSRSLFTQMTGRGTRSLAGTLDNLNSGYERKVAIAASAKPHCLVLDFCGNSGKHKLMTTADILGGKYPEEVRDLAVKKAKESAEPKDMETLLRESDEEIRKRIETARMQEDARRSRLVAKVKYSSHMVDPFDLFGIQPVKGGSWDNGRVLSTGSRNILKKMGVDPDQVGYARGQQLVKAQMQRWRQDLCSTKQALLLKRYGYSDPAKLTFKEASNAIDRIAKNNWRPIGKIDRVDVPSFDAVKHVLSSA